ncbi:hypothetical protein [Halospeciosus flavus]|uniref:hypothetical protein n=1 Tax=Halospeciosus flavus TaxID=3032283 RepID=UPI00361E422D
MSSRRRGDTEGKWSGPLSIDATSEGLTVFDAVERHQCTLWADGDVVPTVADSDRFLFPVDAAVSVETSKLTLPNGPAVFVRTADGETVSEATPPAEVSVDTGTYSIELAAAVKLYVRASGPLTVSTSVSEISVELEDAGEILVGARSRHENPAGTITTTTDPVDMMEAVSHLGSALKTTSPERSYPTLRGHPPLVELGDEVSIPDSVTKPDNGIRLELPAEYRSIYVGAPLAYYLGATMEPAPAPKLVVGDGEFEHRLDTHRGFEAEVERVLKQVFVLDCVTRTEGLYQVDLHEREALESLVDLDFDTLYDADLATQQRRTSTSTTRRSNRTSPTGSRRRTSRRTRTASRSSRSSSTTSRSSARRRPANSATTTCRPRRSATSCVAATGPGAPDSETTHHTPSAPNRSTPSSSRGSARAPRWARASRRRSPSATDSTATTPTATSTSPSSATTRRWTPRATSSTTPTASAPTFRST